MIRASDRFHRWTVASVVRHNGKWYANTTCDCGATGFVSAYTLKRGLSKSCGCLRATTSSALHLKHGDSVRTSPYFKVYQCWLAIKGRCKRNPNYEGRGISVCTRWLDYNTFKADMAASWHPGLSIERIDVNGNYEPSNCRWIPLREQGLNKRNTTYAPNGERVLDLAKRCGLSRLTLRRRLQRGIPLDSAMRIQKYGQRPHCSGERANNNKLTTEQALLAMECPRTRGALDELARRFGVSKALICSIRAGRVWKHLRETMQGTLRSRATANTVVDGQLVAYDLEGTNKLET